MVIDNIVLVPRRRRKNKLALAVASIGCLLGILFYLDHLDRKDRDAVRIEHAKSMMAALEKYRAAKGSYPVLPITDVVIGELTAPLTGYIDRIPEQVQGASQIQYAAFTGTAYGLLVHLERSPGRCMIEVGATRTGWWDQPPPCPL